jgi:hypothetical protein
MVASMTEEEVKGLFALSGIPITRVWEIQNRYWGKNHAFGDLYDRVQNLVNGNVALSGMMILGVQMDKTKLVDELQAVLSSGYADAPPWWLVRVPNGLIEIGWRKRVISIDWTETDVRSLVTSDDVTKSETKVHAWSMENALTYLKTWNEIRIGEKTEKTEKTD